MARVPRVLQRLVRPLLMLAAMPLFIGAECEQPLVMDSGFDVWCGETLCDWQLDEGTIAKVATWHGDDFGVAMIADSTRISQKLPISNDDVSCLHFDLLADIAEPVNVQLDLDFDDDGHVEHTETLPSGTWIPLSYHINAPTYYRGVRIVLRKSGAGHAALARIQASKSSSDDCAGPPLPTSNRPAGAACEHAGDCAGGDCAGGTPLNACANDGHRCASDGDCAAAVVDNSCITVSVAGGRCL